MPIQQYKKFKAEPLNNEIQYQNQYCMFSTLVRYVRRLDNKGKHTTCLLTYWQVVNKKLIHSKEHLFISYKFSNELSEVNETDE